MILNENARQVAMVAGHAEVIIETDLERTRTQLGSVVGARIGGSPIAIPQMPFANGGC